MNMVDVVSGQAFLPKDQVQELLAAQDERVDQDGIFYYPSLENMIETARGSKCWSRHSTFVYAASPDDYVIFCQVAPASCEMMILTQNGFHDVVTAYRYEQEELLDQVQRYLEGDRLGFHPS